MVKAGVALPPRVAIVEAKRTPIGKFLGAFRHKPAVELGADVARAVMELAGISASDVDEVIIGHARQAGTGPNPGRQVAIRAGIPQTTPASTINTACASGVHSIIMGADAIRLGRAECVLAGGMENMTRTPFILDRARLGYRLGHERVLDGMYRDGFMCPLADMLMGETAEVLAAEYSITRDEQDRWAVLSQHRVEESAALLAEEIVPLTAPDDKGRDVAVDADEHPRAGVTLESLAKLPAVFRKDGTVTAGNASGITDGAAAVVLMSEPRLERLGREPLGFIRDAVITGVDPRRMGIGPVPATRTLLERHGMTIGDIPAIELNEAFAAQVLACQRELGFDAGQVNRRGGAISLGHPIGCTGSRIVVTLLHEMRRMDARVGLATLCVSGGLGVAMLIDRT
jgi:acetyl-CoA C-acetyltransferase